MSARLKELYNNEIIEALTKKFGYKNVMEVPKLDKIVINVTSGEIKDNFEKFVKYLANPENETFYKLVYLSLVLKGFGDEEYDIINHCNSVMPFLKEKSPVSDFVVGEWERLNSPRSRQNMAQVGINRAINALIDVGKKTKARELYNEALNNGLNNNTYIEKRL